ncbi:MAG: MoaD/ThiS family protein [Methylococcales bacterium]
MSITVHYFASLKERLGRASDSVDFSPNLTVLDIWRLANPEHPLPAPILVAVNMDYVSLSNPVADGDTVAFFPPVTGG